MNNVSKNKGVVGSNIGLSVICLLNKTTKAKCVKTRHVDI